MDMEGEMRKRKKSEHWADRVADPLVRDAFVRKDWATLRRLARERSEKSLKKNLKAASEAAEKDQAQTENELYHLENGEILPPEPKNE